MTIRKTKYVIGIAFIGVIIAIMIATMVPKSMQYYLTVDELMAAPNDYVGKELKVAGKVAEGSINKKGTDLIWDFVVENEEKTVSVHYEGAMPDTFKEGAEVVVTGKLTSADKMVATNILAKCASRYEEKLEPELKAPADPKTKT